MQVIRLSNGCRCLIYDNKSGDTIIDTKIIEHNLKIGSIWIYAINFDRVKYPQVSVFIFAENGLFEFGGTIKSVVTNSVEIGLFQGKAKEDRKSPRYKFCTNATITSIWDSENEIKLDKPLKMVTQNIGRHGILIAGAPNILEQDTKFMLIMDMDGTERSIMCKVVRVENTPENLAEYGCKFIFNN